MTEIRYKGDDDDEGQEYYFWDFVSSSSGENVLPANNGVDWMERVERVAATVAASSVVRMVNEHAPPASFKRKLKRLFLAGLIVFHAIVVGRYLLKKFESSLVCTNDSPSTFSNKTFSSVIDETMESLRLSLEVSEAVRKELLDKHGSLNNDTLFEENQTSFESLGQINDLEEELEALRDENVRLKKQARDTTDLIDSLRLDLQAWEIRTTESIEENVLLRRRQKDLKIQLRNALMQLEAFSRTSTTPTYPTTTVAEINEPNELHVFWKIDDFQNKSKSGQPIDSRRIKIGDYTVNLCLRPSKSYRHHSKTHHHSRTWRLFEEATTRKTQQQQWRQADLFLYVFGESSDAFPVLLSGSSFFLWRHGGDGRRDESIKISKDAHGPIALGWNSIGNNIEIDHAKDLDDTGALTIHATIRMHPVVKL